MTKKQAMNAHTVNSFLLQIKGEIGKIYRITPVELQNVYKRRKVGQYLGDHLMLIFGF
jgi:hypothetical protein